MVNPDFGRAKKEVGEALAETLEGEKHHLPPREQSLVVNRVASHPAWMCYESTRMFTSDVWESVCVHQYQNYMFPP